MQQRARTAAVVLLVTSGVAFALYTLSKRSKGGKTSPELPPTPPSDSGAAPLAELLGGFAFERAPTRTDPDAIRILDGWDKTNIVRVKVPQLVGIPGAPKDGTILFNKRAAPQFLAMWQAWDDAGLLPLVRSWDGSFAPRFVRGSKSTLSAHAWGAGFDINAAFNRLGAEPAASGSEGSVVPLVKIASDFGFNWGGNFRGRPDGMHFELARIVSVPSGGGGGGGILV